MRLTRSQFESAFGRAIVYFSLAIGTATAIQIALLVGVSSNGVSTNPWAGILLGIVAGVFAILVAGLGSAIVTITLGIVLTIAVERLLRRVSAWPAHFAAYFGIGVLAALVPVALYIWATLSSESLASLGGDWLTIVDLVLITLLAGLSTSLAWHHVWRRPTPSQPAETLSERALA